MSTQNFTYPARDQAGMMRLEHVWVCVCVCFPMFFQVRDMPTTAVPDLAKVKVHNSDRPARKTVQKSAHTSQYCRLLLFG